MPSVNIQPHPSIPQNTNTNSTSSHFVTLNDEKEDENNLNLNLNQNGTGISIINNQNHNQQNGNSNIKTNVIKPPLTTRHDDDMSSETNEFVRLRDGMERQAFEWLEQELLSHFISKMANQHVNQNQNQNIDLDFVNENDQDIIDSQTLMLINFLGKKGFQLFVDMGLEVDPNLIELLIREVLEEKIANIISSETNESHVGESLLIPLNNNQDEGEEEIVQKQQPQPSPRKTIDYLEHQKEERPLSLDIDTPIPTPPSHRSPTSTRPIIIAPTQPPPPTTPLPPHETINKQPKQKNYIVLEEEENFSELDVTLEEDEEDDLQGD